MTRAIAKEKMYQHLLSDSELTRSEANDSFEMQIIDEIYDSIKPKSCEGCLYHEESDGVWGVCSNMGSWLYLENTPYHATCIFFEPKDTP